MLLYFEKIKDKVYLLFRDKKIRVWIIFDKTALEYVIVNQHGKISELMSSIGTIKIMEFKKLRIIRLGLLKWTELAGANELYIRRYGYLSYLYLHLKSNKMMRKISNFFMKWLNSQSMTPTAMIPVC